MDDPPGSAPETVIITLGPWPIQFTSHDIKQQLSALYIAKTMSPDNIVGKVLNTCTL